MSDGHPILARHRQGFDELNRFWTQIQDLEASVEQFAEEALSFVEEPVERVLDRIRAFEPSVSVIGQVKAGKSTLLNALIGETSLLPSDVNPWTSVITAIHLNSRHRPPRTRAVFRFFDAHEWDRLVSTGGRLGEMADRAGFEAEAEEVRSQVTEMRQSTEARLGDKFQSLLGSSHAFPELDRDTIDRYICYGDPEELAGSAGDGVFADLTKSADLYVDLDGFPKGLCLRDTPGVNDTFMMREQITLNAISDSRVCVVVLSAHQALSTMDLALLRIICSVEAREVLIFVNRIDELVDPVAEQEKIGAGIRKTLTRLGFGDGIQILFGSGYWANCALDDRCDAMAPASRAALERVSAGQDLSSPDALRAAALEASGVGALHRAIATRVVEGPGKAFLRDVQKEVDQILAMNDSVVSIANATSGVRRDALPSETELSMKIADARDKAIGAFEGAAAGLRENLHKRLVRAQDAFVTSALEALAAHMKVAGEIGTWNHDPTSLRMTMKTSFTSACARLRREGEAAFEIVLDGLADITEQDLGVYQDTTSVTFPEQPQHRAPTVLAKTISLDLEGRWWRRFWHFGGKIDERYRELVIAETTPLIDELLTGFFDPAVDRTRDVIVDFAADRAKFVHAILECASEGAPHATPSVKPTRPSVKSTRKSGRSAA